MSASERLRVLGLRGEWEEPDLWLYYMTEEESEAIGLLRNALPLIADHTKAAEDVLHEYHLWAEDANDGEFAIWSRDEFMAAFHRLQMADNALQEALDANG